jgi:alpha-beta hydrolase superfamily lysophospholipase
MFEVQIMLSIRIALNFIFILCCVACNSDSSLENAQESFQEENFQRCLNQVQENTDFYLDRLEGEYKATDPSIVSDIKEEHRPLFLRGSSKNKAVLLLHGILSSPRDLSKLANEFNKNGLSVLVPLLPGFGSNVKVANSSTLGRWQEAVDYHYQTLSLCFNKVSLVGFSLGGALSVDFALNRYPKLRQEGAVADMTSLLLLSPAIRPSETFIWLKAHTTLFFTDAVPLWFISKFKKDPDIENMMKDPERHYQHFPVYVGLGLRDLSLALEKSQGPFEEHPLFVSINYSQSDLATDWFQTRNFLADNFFDVRVFSYHRKTGIPHSLYLEEDTQVGQEMREGLTRFVLRFQDAELSDSRVITD